MALISAVCVICVSYIWMEADIPTSFAINELDSRGAAELEIARLQADSKRNALAAGAGIIAMVGLLVAFRRQRHSEHQQLYHEYESHRSHRQREISDESAQHDALQRRITDSRIRAVDQLGSESSTVRIGGLHNLERIGEQHEELRQIVIDEICAYLRMPFITAPQVSPHPASSASLELIGHRSKPDASIELEREVRKLAQEILERHLNPELGDGEYWDHSRINLRNSYLDNINLSKCLLGKVDFEGTTFAGNTSFDQAIFCEDVNFRRARFMEESYLSNADFQGSSNFSGVEFHGDASFIDSHFRGSAIFDGANFKRRAVFWDATFLSNSYFNGVVFSKGTELDWVSFGQLPEFVNTRFNGIFEFDDDLEGYMKPTLSIEAAELLYDVATSFRMGSTYKMLPTGWEIKASSHSPEWGHLARPERSPISDS
jgi:uncharacterized protein YjbI with pentapeptide repeats